MEIIIKMYVIRYSVFPLNIIYPSHIQVMYTRTNTSRRQISSKEVNRDHPKPPPVNIKLTQYRNKIYIYI